VGEKVYVMGRRHEVKEGTGYLEALIWGISRLLEGRIAMAPFDEVCLCSLSAWTQPPLLPRGLVSRLRTVNAIEMQLDPAASKYLCCLCKISGQLCDPTVTWEALPSHSYCSIILEARSRLTVWRQSLVTYRSLPADRLCAAAYSHDCHCHATDTVTTGEQHEILLWNLVQLWH
jgi:hypothetical protein